MADRKKEVRPLANPLIETSSKHANVPDATALMNKILQNQGVQCQQPQNDNKEN